MRTDQKAGQDGISPTSIQKVEAEGVNVFYRAAGDISAPVVLLLHGFPSSFLKGIREGLLRWGGGGGECAHRNVRRYYRCHARFGTVRLQSTSARRGNGIWTFSFVCAQRDQRRIAPQVSKSS